MNPILYVAGKYTDATPEAIRANIELARKYTAKLWAIGYWCFSPIINTDFPRADDLPYNGYLDFDLSVMEFVPFFGIYLLPNWKTSKGANRELLKAREKKMVEIYSLHEANEVLREYHQSCGTCGR